MLTSFSPFPIRISMVSYVCSFEISPKLPKINPKTFQKDSENKHNKLQQTYLKPSKKVPDSLPKAVVDNKLNGDARSSWLRSNANLAQMGVKCHVILAMMCQLSMIFSNECSNASITNLLTMTGRLCRLCACFFQGFYMF